MPTTSGELPSAEGDVYWALADNLGSVRDIVEYESGTGQTSVVNHIDYDAFGNITGETAAAGMDYALERYLYSYTGREWDADAEMYAYRARWYDPVVGRFISEDPIGFAAGDTNISRYVGNGVTNATDPGGLFDERLFWANVQKLDPAAYKWFMQEGGRLEQSDPWVYPWDRYATLKNGKPYVWIDSKANEIEAAMEFSAAIRKDAPIAGFFNSSGIANAMDNSCNASRNFHAAMQKGFATTADYAAALSNVYMSVLSIVNEGADWVITVNDIVQGEADFYTLVGMLPLVSKGTVKLADKSGKVIKEISVDAIRRSGLFHGSADYVRKYWEDYYKTVGHQGDDLTNVISQLEASGFVVRKGECALFKTGTNIIEYGPNTKVWELHEEALHHAVGGGLGKDEIASLTKELRRHFKATKGQGPRMAAEEIYVKMRLLERSDLDDATRTLLTRQIQTLRNRGMKDGY